MRRKLKRACRSLLILPCVLFVMTGCQLFQPHALSWIENWSPKKVVSRVMPAKRSSLKKKVMVLPLIDQAKIGPTREARITENLKALLRQSPNLLVYDPPESIALPKSDRFPELGLLNHPELLKRAEYFGMDAVITGVLNPVEATSKKKGIWPFRKYRRIYNVSASVYVVDVNSKTFLLNHQESVQVDFPQDEDEEDFDRKFDQDAFLDEALQETIPQILKRQAKAIEERLATEPWTGKIVSVENGTLTIDGGSEVGIHPGQVLMVYGKGEAIRCKDGKTLELLGNKIGRIKITSAAEREAIAKPLDEGAFLEGQVVRDIY